MTKTLSGQVSKYVAAYKDRLDAVFRQSLQDVAVEASRPRDQGGRMPVVTSFLRNSISAAVASVPTGASRPVNKGDGGNEAALNDVILKIASAQAGGPEFYIGWTANYAKYMNYRYGFLTAAAQNWPKYVRANSARAKREFK